MFTIDKFNIPAVKYTFLYIIPFHFTSYFYIKIALKYQIIHIYIGSLSPPGNGLKKCKTSSSRTSSSLDGFHIGLLSLRTSTAVTPVEQDSDEL